MGTLQKAFNQAITGATFLLQQTPIYKEIAEERQEKESKRKEFKKLLEEPPKTNLDFQFVTNPTPQKTNLDFKLVSMKEAQKLQEQFRREQEERREFQKLLTSKDVGELKKLGIPKNIIEKARYN